MERFSSPASRNGTGDSLGVSDTLEVDSLGVLVDMGLKVVWVVSLDELGLDSEPLDEVLIESSDEGKQTDASVRSCFLSESSASREINFTPHLQLVVGPTVWSKGGNVSK